jgi:two-component system sensor histidine kinase PilS (NtrC family)
MQAAEQAPEFIRLWRGFMTARVTLGLLLLLFQLTLYHLGQNSRPLTIALCAAYLALALAARLRSRPRPLGRHFDLTWAHVIGVDIVVFTLLQWQQVGNINYTPLLALPVLLASVLGSLLLALGTAAGVTLLLLGHAAWLALRLPFDVAPLYIEAALTSAGYFAIAVLAHQLSARLAREELRAQRSQLAARIQQQVNALVIESLSEGILVVNARGIVHAANPAARHLLQVQEAPFDLRTEPGWRALAELARDSHQRQAAQQADITLLHPTQGPRRVHVRTRPTPPMATRDESLCVLFLQDLREQQARLRTEKLASMGRMSAAVAHEIRNPLAAISQANALLDEDLREPRHQQLTRMVRQNAQRLEKIVEDILDLSRVPSPAPSDAPLIAALDATVADICQDWAAQHPDDAHRLRLDLTAARQSADFEPEHLRRVLVNLLDNARRHASARADAIQVSSRPVSDALVSLAVWSDSAPMEPSVEQHLFEPFFSSQSRSSGLGLYICRELCERHGAVIGHRRARREVAGASVEGNEFFVSLHTTPAHAGAPHPPQPVTPWH